jgi:hypothetical protein
MIILKLLMTLQVPINRVFHYWDGHRCYIRNAIIDKNVRIGNDVASTAAIIWRILIILLYTIKDGVVVMKKGALFQWICDLNLMSGILAYSDIESFSDRRFYKTGFIFLCHLVSALACGEILKYLSPQRLISVITGSN